MVTRNVYDVCPVYESARFQLRLVERDDAEALLRCYADPAARPCFNMDNCDFGYDEAPSLETQRRVVDIWLEVYRLRQFVRFAIVDRADGAAVGTVEMFGGKHGVLRVDIASAYETQEALAELFGLADAFFGDFGCERMVTKVFDASPQRTRALVACGFAPYPAGEDWTRDGYWAKLAPAAPLPSPAGS